MWMLSWAWGQSEASPQDLVSHRGPWTGGSKMTWGWTCTAGWKDMAWSQLTGKRGRSTAKPSWTSTKRSPSTLSSFSRVRPPLLHWRDPLQRDQVLCDWSKQRRSRSGSTQTYKFSLLLHQMGRSSHWSSSRRARVDCGHVHQVPEGDSLPLGLWDIWEQVVMATGWCKLPYSSDSTAAPQGTDAIFFTKDMWPPQSCDLAPMDYAVFGHSKAMLSDIRYITKQQLKSAIISAWANLDETFIKKSCAQMYDTWVSFLASHTGLLISPVTKCSVTYNFWIRAHRYFKFGTFWSLIINWSADAQTLTQNPIQLPWKTADKKSSGSTIWAKRIRRFSRSSTGSKCPRCSSRGPWTGTRRSRWLRTGQDQVVQEQ